MSPREIEQGFPNLVSRDAYYGLSNAKGILVQITRADGWGAPRVFKGKGIEVSIPVSSRSQGQALLKYLLAPYGVDTSVFSKNPERRGADLAEGIFAEFEMPRETAGNIEPSMRLVLRNSQSHSIDAGRLLVEALINRGLYLKRGDEIKFDMTTNTGRHEWAVRTFSLNRSLSNDEHRALYEIGGPAFRDINGSLRRDPSLPDRRVPFVDSAIAKGTTDRPVMIYRSVHRDDLIEIWESMTKAQTDTVEISPDPAYLFGSLDPQVARWWQHSWNAKKDGVILEIETPIGTHLAYIDSVIHDRRGYLEMVLPRNAKMTALSASKDGDYRILRVRLN